MITRLFNLWNRLRSSLWLIPSIMSVGAFFVAVGCNLLDQWLAQSNHQWLRDVLYHGDLDGARTLLSTVAGSMITVAGVTFSVTVVALSLASSQFGPRLLVSFMRDSSNQFVLGTFISTFLFCLVALGNVGDADAVFPAVSTSMGFVMAVCSVAVLIFFIHHVSSSIRAEHVVDVVARDLVIAFEKLLSTDEIPKNKSGNVAELKYASSVHAFANGYIQAVDESTLKELAVQNNCVIQLRLRPGKFVVEEEVLADISCEKSVDTGLASQVERCFIIGRYRTDEQDPEYGIDQLVEIAVRALSPGINDPHTAISCIDWLAASLQRVANEKLKPAEHFDDEGNLRLILDAITFKGLIASAFDQIRQCAYGMPAVSIRLMESLTGIARKLESQERKTNVREQADVLMAGAIESGMQETDKKDLERRHKAVVDMLES